MMGFVAGLNHQVELSPFEKSTVRALQTHLATSSALLCCCPRGWAPSAGTHSHPTALG